jgi:hypothetical protein
MSAQTRWRTGVWTNWPASESLHKSKSVIASVAKQSIVACQHGTYGSPRRCAPRDDGLMQIFLATKRDAASAMRDLCRPSLAHSTPANIITSTPSPTAILPWSCGKTIRPLACTIELSTPEPC